MNPQHLALLNSLLNLGGTGLKAKYPQGLNISLYFSGTQSREPGLFKIEELAYRGDSRLLGRSDKYFYSLEKDEAAILDAMRQKSSVWKKIDQSQTHKRPLTWVYASPLLMKGEVVAILCFSGSSTEDSINTIFRENIEKVSDSLIDLLGQINDLLDFSSSWKDEPTSNEG